MVERLIDMSYEERVANPCIGSERADLVLAGCAILEAIRREFPCRRVRVADRGLREGMLVQMMRADGVWGHASGRRAERTRRDDAFSGCRAQAAIAAMKIARQAGCSFGPAGAGAGRRGRTPASTGTVVIGMLAWYRDGTFRSSPSH